MCNDNVFDLDLVKTLDSAIKSKQKFLEKQCPPDFAFTIHDKDDLRDERAFDSLVFTEFRRGGRPDFRRGGRPDYRRGGRHGLEGDEVGLTREFDGESIQVKVEMPYQWTDCYRYGGRRRKEDEDASLELTVKILKENGKTLTFEVSASEVITIGSMWIAVPTDEDKYPHPEHFRVGEDSCLHSGLKEYLRVRGIDESTTDFLRKYMRRKSKNQPVIVLKNLKKFLEN